MLYSKKVMEHFRNPKNMGEIKDADGVATVGNKLCGDVMKLYIKIAKRKTRQKLKHSGGQAQDAKRKKEYIKDIKFQTLGCAAAIATSSILTEMAKGRPLSEAEEITNKAIAEALNGLPKAKLHCSVLAANALKKAIEDYRKRQANAK